MEKKIVKDIEILKLTVEELLKTVNTQGELNKENIEFHRLIIETLSEKNMKTLLLEFLTAVSIFAFGWLMLVVLTVH